jgi:YD repeat-containing protein
VSGARAHERLQLRIAAVVAGRANLVEETHRRQLRVGGQSGFNDRFVGGELRRHWWPRAVVPTKTARVLDDGTSKIFQATYNSQGHVTSRTDPVGRTTTFTYTANGIDLLQTYQGTDFVSSFTNYANHLPLTAVDAAGQTTTYAYNLFGQRTTITNAKGEQISLTYDADHHLTTISQPLGAVTTFTYDGYGRVRAQTGPDGYTTITDYDVFDRVIRTTYPDGTFEALTYDRLDLVARTDRLARTTRYFFDPLRRLVATRDPAGRTVTQQWCKCGSLDKMTDANGNFTSWDRDVQARVTREVRADGTTTTQYAYETSTSRPKSVTDPKGQVTTYTYLADNTLQQIVFTNAEHTTPSVTYALLTILPVTTEPYRDHERAVNVSQTTAACS